MFKYHDDYFGLYKKVGKILPTLNSKNLLWNCMKLTWCGKCLFQLIIATSILIKRNGWTNNNKKVFTKVSNMCIVRKTV